MVTETGKWKLKMHLLASISEMLGSSCDLLLPTNARIYLLTRLLNYMKKEKSMIQRAVSIKRYLSVCLYDVFDCLYMYTIDICVCYVRVCCVLLIQEEAHRRRLQHTLS